MKKIIIILIGILIISCIAQKEERSNFSIDIWDSNYSLAYTLIYHVDDNELWIKKVGTLQGENDSILFIKDLNTEEKDLFRSYLNRFPIDSLKSIYNNPLAQDGNQKKFLININGKKKSIEVSNVYQNDLGELIDLINKISSSDYKMSYSPR